MSHRTPQQVVERTIRSMFPDKLIIPDVLVTEIAERTIKDLRDEGWQVQGSYRG